LKHWWLQNHEVYDNSHIFRDKLKQDLVRLTIEKIPPKVWTS